MKQMVPIKQITHPVMRDTAIIQMTCVFSPFTPMFVVIPVPAPAPNAIDGHVSEQGEDKGMANDHPTRPPPTKLAPNNYVQKTRLFYYPLETARNI